MHVELIRMFASLLSFFHIAYFLLSLHGAARLLTLRFVMIPILYSLIIWISLDHSCTVSRLYLAFKLSCTIVVLCWELTINLMNLKPHYITSKNYFLIVCYWNEISDMCSVASMIPLMIPREQRTWGRIKFSALVHFFRYTCSKFCWERWFCAKISTETKFPWYIFAVFSD